MQYRSYFNFGGLLKRALFLMGFCIILGSKPAGAAGEIESQVDEVQTDIEAVKSASKKLFGKDARLVPIPIPISNPTIGTGLALTLLYLHPQKSQEPDAPTTATGVFGMYTDSESWAVGAIHDGFYRDDHIRFRVPAFHGEFNLDFYGIGNDSPFEDNPVEYNAVTDALIPRLLFRLPWDHWFLGGQYALVKINTTFELSNLLPDAPGIDAQAQTSGLGLVALYDSRNSNFWPSEGSWLELTATQYSEYIGGDFNYFTLLTKWAQYFPVKDKFSFVYRLDGQFLDGRAPFWALSRIRLRGYPGVQFLDNVALTAQAEMRWNFSKRWTALAFGGGGRIADTVGDLGSAPTNWAGGGGMRYMLVEKRKLVIGIDIAYAEGSDVTVYFQVGDWLAN
jgi:hypothetical protein